MTAPYFRAADSSPVSTEDAMRAWAATAHEVLVAIASRYGRAISPEQLARLVQERSGVSSTEPPANWLTRVLTMIVHRCNATGLPPLTSLVVNPETGQVGPAYSELQRVTGGQVLNDLGREQSAAQGRLDCYRRFAADVPADARPTLPSQVIRAREKAARAPRAPRQPAAPRVVKREPSAPAPETTRICPKCFLETPINGECQNCA